MPKTQRTPKRAKVPVPTRGEVYRNLGEIAKDAKPLPPKKEGRTQPLPQTEVTMPEPAQDAGVYLDAARDLVHLLGQVDDALDVKLGTLFAGGSAVIALVAALFALNPTVLQGHSALVLGGAIAVYCALTCVVGTALYPRALPTGSQLTAVRKDALNSVPVNSMKWGVAETLLKDIEDLRHRASKKSRQLKCAFVLTAVEVLVFVIATIALL